MFIQFFVISLPSAEILLIYFSNALSYAFFQVLRNTLPSFLPLVPCSVIESYECDGTHFKDQSESVQFRFSARVSLKAI